MTDYDAWLQHDPEPSGDPRVHAHELLKRLDQWLYFDKTLEDKDLYCSEFFLIPTKLADLKEINKLFKEIEDYLLTSS